MFYIASNLDVRYHVNNNFYDNRCSLHNFYWPSIDYQMKNLPGCVHVQSYSKIYIRVIHIHTSKYFRNNPHITPSFKILNSYGVWSSSPHEIENIAYLWCKNTLQLLHCNCSSCVNRFFERVDKRSTIVNRNG